MKKKTHVLITTAIFPPEVGGPATYVPWVAEELANLGWDVTVLAIGVEDGNTYNFNLFRINPHLKKTILYWLSLFQCLRLARSTDVVYVNGMNVPACMSAVVWKRPIVVKVVGDYAWERARRLGWTQVGIDEYQSMRKGIGLRFLDALRNLPLHLAKTIVVPSEYLRDIVKGWGITEKKIKVVYNAIPFPPAFKRELWPDGKRLRVLSVGRLIPEKRIDRVISVIERLEFVELVVVGSGPEEKRLVEMVKGLDLEHRVKFLGAKSRDEVHSLMRECDVFILNSVYEGLPHTLIEALANSMVVIAHRVGGVVEVISHLENGILFETEEEVERWLIRLWENRELGKTLSSKARESVERKFSISQHISRLQEVLSEAAGVGG